MLTLTARQQEILSFIQEFMDAEGFPPTRAEIARALGFRSVNAAEDHLKALVRKSAIEILPGVSRGIRILGASEEGLPVVGRVAAGHPILAEQNIEDRYEIAPRLFRPRAHYLLRVKGMSMRDAGILDGDTVIIERCDTADNGTVVVALVEGQEVTLKRLRRRNHSVALEPANRHYETRIFGPDQVEVQGRLVGLMRQY